MSDKLPNSYNGRYQHNYSYVVSQAKRVATHMRRHQNKYFFLGGLVGGAFLFVKVIMLFGASFMLYNAGNNASFADDVVIVGEQEDSSVTIDELEDLLGTEGEIFNEETDVSEDSSTEIENTNEVKDSSVESEEENQPESEDSQIESGNDVIVVEDDDLNLPDNLPELVCDYKNFSIDLTGKYFSGIMSLSWNSPLACGDEAVDIQLYDHNEEWITLDSLPGYIDEYEFDTTKLMSGFYSQTGLNSSGEVEIIYQGLYEGVSTDEWSGYYIRRIVQPDNILHQTKEFTIDNRPPEVSEFKMSVNSETSGLVLSGQKIKVSFKASEELTGTKLYINSRLIDDFESDGLIYSGEYVVGNDFPKGKIGYELLYQDLAGNGKMLKGQSDLYFDTESFELGGFSLSGYNFSFSTTKESTANAFVVVKGTTNGWAFDMTDLSTKHQISLPTLSLNTEYDMGIVAKDVLGNEAKAAFSLNRTNNGDIKYTLLATLYGGKLVTYGTGKTFLSETGAINQTGASILTEFRKELDKFNQCKNDIEYSKVKIQIKGTELELNVPMFQKSEIKKLVNSFVVYILKELEKAPLSKKELINIANNFDGFLVIMKLLKDDNNICKQSLSTHAISQFTTSLDRYGIDF